MQKDYFDFGSPAKMSSFAKRKCKIGGVGTGVQKKPLKFWFVKHLAKSQNNWANNFEIFKQN